MISEVQAIRNVRSAWQINPKQLVTVVIKTSREREMQILRKYSTEIVHLAKVGSLKMGKKLVRPKDSVVANIGRVETYVVLAGLVDVSVERQRIEAALADVKKMIRDLDGRLQNESFVKKAPKQVVEREQHKAAELVNRQKRLEDNVRSLPE